MSKKLAIAILALGSTALLATSASASDLPRKRTKAAKYVAAPVYVPAARTWTGAYAGAQLGGSWRKHGNGAFVGGVHAGYNHQVNDALVLGVEGDIEGNTANRARVINGVSVATKSPLQGSLRARAGFLATPKTMVYVTGGAALAGFQSTYDGRVRHNTTKVGYTVGAGVEHAVSDTMTIRAEYRYTDYGNVGHTLAGGTVVPNKIQDHSVRAGLSWRF